MNKAAILGVVLGLLAGVAVGVFAPMRLGPAFWIPVLTLVGGTQGWIGGWILRQSNDVPKMRAAVPLTGPVLASIACVFTGEAFLFPVLGTIIVGILIGFRLARTGSA